jgi:hypothetical protein
LQANGLQTFFGLLFLGRISVGHWALFDCEQKSSNRQARKLRGGAQSNYEMSCAGEQCRPGKKKARSKMTGLESLWERMPKRRFPFAVQHCFSQVRKEHPVLQNAQ